MQAKCIYLILFPAAKNCSAHASLFITVISMFPNPDATNINWRRLKKKKTCFPFANEGSHNAMLSVCQDCQDYLVRQTNCLHFTSSTTIQYNGINPNPINLYVTWIFFEIELGGLLYSVHKSWFHHTTKRLGSFRSFEFFSRSNGI